MNCWIFQSVVDRYDLREVDVVRPDKTDTWYATRYKSKMAVGDRVYFWLGGLGEARGVYAVGHITSETYTRPEWDSDGIDIIYDAKVNPPLLVGEIRANAVLANLLILRAAQATNFLLSPEEASELASLTESREVHDAE